MKKFNISNLSKREKIIALLAGVITSAAVLVNFIITPVIDKILSNNDIIRQKSDYLSRYSPLLKRSSDSVERFKDYEEFLGREQSTEEILNEIFTKTEDLAGKMQISIMEVKPLAFNESGQNKKISVELLMSGQLGSIFKFVEELESSMKLINIDSIIISPHADGKNLKCSMVLDKLFLN